MAQSSSKQNLANLMHGYNQIIELARRVYNDPDLKDWAVQKSLEAEGNFTETNEKLKEFFSIDFTSDTAKKSIIKEGSEVEVLVDHMDGMKGSKAIVKSYSIPAMLSDITMKDGMKMNSHKWLTNDEVKLK
jgi:hypothetical protein